MDETNDALDLFEERLAVIEASQKSVVKDMKEVRIDLKGIWQDILRLDNRTEDIRQKTK